MAKVSEMNLKVRPLDDRVVVEPLEAEERTSGGILLPDTAKQKPQRGRVLAAGPGKVRDTGERHVLNLRGGGEVLYGKYSCSVVDANGCEFKILRESGVLAE